MEGTKAYRDFQRDFVLTNIRYIQCDNNSQNIPLQITKSYHELYRKNLVTVQLF
jgi:hypothetical protein